jgi:hypothetical protein
MIRTMLKWFQKPPTAEGQSDRAHRNSEAHVYLAYGILFSVLTLGYLLAAGLAETDHTLVRYFQ